MIGQFLSLFIVLCSFSIVHGQHVFSVDARFKYGFLVAHRPIMSHLPKEHTKAFELSLNWQTQGHKPWQRALKNPIFGLSFLGTSVGNKEILGNHFGSYAFLMYPFMKQKSHGIYGRVGTGLGFTRTVFDQESNPKNNAISSHVNALINFGLIYRFTAKQHAFSFGLDLTHFSNGSSRLPNLGLNLPYAMLGYAFTPTYGTLKHPATDEQFVPRRKWEYHLMLIGSVKDSYPTGSKRSGIFGVNLAMQRIYTVGKGFETGFDLMYKPATDTYKPVIEKPIESLWQTGTYAAYLMNLGRLQIIVGMGVYLRDEYVPDDAFYHRMGFRYSFNDKMRCNLTLKSHWAKADYVEYGVAYRF